MRFLFRVYLNALLNGNPIALIPTLVVVVAVSVGPFYEGLSQRDPGAIALASLIGLLFTVLLVVAIVDRKLNPKKTPNAPSKPRRR